MVREPLAVRYLEPEFPFLTLTSATPGGILYDSGINPQTPYMLLDITPGRYVGLALLELTREIFYLTNCRVYLVCERDDD